VTLGEVSNFLAYSYAPAILVTPLGAVSVLVGAVLSHFILKERLGKDGVIGCVLCVLGSLMVILHSPEEEPIDTVDDVFRQFTQPGFSFNQHSCFTFSAFQRLLDSSFTMSDRGTAKRTCWCISPSAHSSDQYQSWQSRDSLWLSN
jgi:hypothetical protein